MVDTLDYSKVLEEFKQRVKNLEKCRIDGPYRWNHGSAHCGEDDIYEEFIEFVAMNGPDHLSEIARAVLETNKYDFHRHHGG